MPLIEWLEWCFKEVIDVIGMRRWLLPRSIGRIRTPVSTLSVQRQRRELRPAIGQSSRLQLPTRIYWPQLRDSR